MCETLTLDPTVCEQARLSRDSRFDGLFFTAVRSTGIYCRPVCPAPAPLARHVTYYPSAAAAAAAGYRPCLRCRPEKAPGRPAWRSGSALVTAALQRIDDGFLDTAPVSALAARVGVGERHLRRLFQTELGASPLQVAATRRLLFAKQLLGETTLPVTNVALASGYGSVRRFNAAFRGAYRMSPSQLRRGHTRVSDGVIEMRLPLRPPYDFEAMLAFLSRRALPGLERVDITTYRRVFAHNGMIGDWSLRRAPGDAHALLLCVRHPQAQVLTSVVARVRRMCDLDADPAAIDAVLDRDRRLHGLRRRYPGLRLPGAWDGFETAVRAVLGQQVSVTAARTLAARVMERWGEPVVATDGVPVSLFPTPAALAEVDLAEIGLTRQRAATVRTLARAVCDGRVGFEAGQGLEAFVEAWTELSGIGDWTAHYIALRALCHPDAFPAADLILRRAVGGGQPLGTTQLRSQAQAWRPWRGYATILLWRSQSE